VQATEAHDTHQATVRDSVAGFLSAAAIFAGIASLFWFPARLGPAAIVVSLVATGIATQTRRFQGLAVFCASFLWLAGMVVAVVLNRPMF
jgi:hypothetical protein